MHRFVVSLFTFALVALPLIAADQPSATTKLTVSPAAAPVPSLKYELLPRLRDTKPGNRALEYARAFDLRPAPVGDKKEREAQEKTAAAWEDGPLDKLPVEEVKKYLEKYANLFRTMDSAARLERYDSEWVERIRAEGITMLLPGVQSIREVARYLRLRYRVELAEGRYEDAARTLQTILRAAKDEGQNPTLIQMLVGLAVTNVALGEVEQWVQKPGSPNLYWALTVLPRPFVDPRPGVEGEAVFFDALVPNAREFEKGVLTAARANELLTTMFNSLGKAADGGNETIQPLQKLLTGLGLPLYLTEAYPKAKKALLAEGMPAELVDKMPGAQVVGLRAVRFVRQVYDDMVKGFSLPYPIGREQLQVEKKLKAAQMDSGDALMSMAAMLLPAIQKVHESHGRTERKLAALRALEAVRLYAAANDGKPPRSLTDITAVPVPDDPWTGKPFEYAADGQSFTLAAPPPPGQKPDTRNSLRYEVTMRGK